jgi:hypothetical protein
MYVCPIVVSFACIQGVNVYRHNKTHVCMHEYMNGSTYTYMHIHINQYRKRCLSAVLKTFKQVQKASTNWGKNLIDPTAYIYIYICVCVCVCVCVCECIYISFRRLGRRSESSNCKKVCMQYISMYKLYLYIHI